MHPTMSFDAAAPFGAFQAATDQIAAIVLIYVRMYKDSMGTGMTQTNHKYVHAQKRRGNEEKCLK